MARDFRLLCFAAELVDLLHDLMVTLKDKHYIIAFSQTTDFVCQTFAPALDPFDGTVVLFYDFYQFRDGRIFFDVFYAADGVRGQDEEQLVDIPEVSAIFRLWRRYIIVCA